MTDNTTLDAAILVAKKAEWKHHDLPNDAFQNNIGVGERTYARALITHLFANIEPPEGATCYEVDLFNDAKRAVLKAAGLEVES